MKEHLVQASDIALHVRAKNWEEAVHAVGMVMVQNGHVTEEYVAAMQQAVRELGPYIVIAPGLAMPHANSKCGVNHSAIGIITLEEPVAFGNAANDPVYMLIGVAGVNDNQHLDYIKAIALVFEDDDALEKLLNIQEPEELAAIFSRAIERGKEG